MKITAKISVQASRTSFSFSLEDLGVTAEQWEKMEQKERDELVQKAVDNEPDQPYYIVESYEEK